MPAAKRSAPKEAKVATERAKKAPKKEAETPACKELEKDDFQNECESILALLTEDGSSIQESAKDMLLVAAPFALKPAKADRHDFQDQTVKMLTNLFDGVKDHNATAVQGFETKAAEAASEQSSLQQALEDANAKEAEAKTARDAAEKALAESTKARTDAKKDMEDASTQLEALKAEKEQCILGKAQREEFIETFWPKLRDGELKAAELRTRNKQLMSIIISLDGEESLKLALPVALKAKPDQRGMIGLKAIETTEEMLQQSLKDIAANIENKDSEIEKQTGVVTEKTQAVESVGALFEEKQNGLIAAENTLMHAQEEIKSKKEALQKVEGANKSIRDELHSAQEKFNGISSLLARFDAIVEGGELVTKKKEESPMEVEAQAEPVEGDAPEQVPDKVEDIAVEAA